MADFVAGDDIEATGANAFATALYQCLENTQGDGAFVTESDLGEINPGLTIDSLGSFGLPLSEDEIARITRTFPAKCATPNAPNATTGRMWEIDAHSITLAHPGWTSHEANALNDTCVRLGIPRDAHQPSLKLEKLVIIEEGYASSTFLRSWDGRLECAKMMIHLPCAQTGGDMSIQVGPKSITLRHALATPWSCTQYSWLGDAEVQLQPLQSGHRVMLIYNLECSGRVLPPFAAHVQRKMDDLVAVLTEWRDAPLDQRRAPPHMMYMLKGKYDDSNLSLDRLQGLDQRRATCLANAAKEAHITCFLGAVEKTIHYDHIDERKAPEHLLQFTSLHDLSGKIVIKHRLSVDEQSVAKYRPEAAVETLMGEGEDEDDVDDGVIQISGGCESCSCKCIQLRSRYEDMEKPGHTTTWTGTALLIIPQTHLMEFFINQFRLLWNSRRSFGLGNGICDLLEYLSSTVRTSPEDQLGRANLAHLCRMVLNENAMTRRHQPGHALPHCEKTVAAVAGASLILRDLPVFEEALMSADIDVHALRKFVLPAALQIPFGRLRPAFDGTVAQMTVLQSPYRERRIAKIHTIASAFKSVARQDQNELKSWTKSHYSMIFEQVPLDTKIVIPTLLAVVKLAEDDAWVDDWILPLLKKNSHKTELMLAFISAMYRVVDEGALKQHLADEVMRGCIHLVLGNFTIPPVFQQHRPVIAAPPPGLVLEDVLLLHIKLRGLNMKWEVDELLRRIASESALCAEEYFRSLIFPLLKEVLRSTDSRTDAYRTASIDALRHYVNRCLPPGPTQPDTWAQSPQRPCHAECAECRDLNRFIESSEKTWQVEGSEYRRQHILRKIRRDFEFEILKGKFPIVLVVTKTNNAWKREWEAWKAKVDIHLKHVDDINLPSAQREALLRHIGIGPQGEPLANSQETPPAPLQPLPQALMTHPCSHSSAKRTVDGDENAPPSKRAAIPVIDLCNSP